ncbi:hypothetical protein G7Y79_00051g087050 [Physcia stellaris]|nr:hypothetical protein G7Y79_00051g087050 [Physcia stellaris]
MAESPGKMVALAIVLSILAVVAVLLRFYARRIKGTEFAWDDYLIVPALAFTIATAVCMLVVMILILPIPSIWRLQMPSARKAAVSGIFLLGALVVVAGAAKLIIFRRIAEEVGSGNEDIADVLTPTVYWPMVESSLGILGACLPSMRPVFTGCSSRGFVRKLRSISYYSSSPSTTYHDRVEHGTRTSDGDSAMTIAHMVPAKVYYPEDHIRLNKYSHADSGDAELLDLEKRGGMSEKTTEQ